MKKNNLLWHIAVKLSQKRLFKWYFFLEDVEKVTKKGKKATLDPWVKVFKIFPKFQDFEVGLQWLASLKILNSADNNIFSELFQHI